VGTALGATNEAVVAELTNPPIVGFIVHVTPVLDVPVTVAVSDWVCAGSNVAVAGVSETETGDPSTTVAVPKMAGFATLVAFTTTV
jgi:hypothetical protein